MAGVASAYTSTKDGNGSGHQKKIKVGFSDGSNGSSDGSSDGSRHEMPNDVLQNTQNTHQTLHPVQNTTHAQVDPLDPLDPSKKTNFYFFW